MSHLSDDLLHRACMAGDLDRIKHYIIAEKYDVNAENYLGTSPLCVSCGLGHLDIVKFLLTIPECEVNFKSSLTGSTPLHIASLRQHEAIVEELLKSKKCDVNCKLYQNGNTPLHIAVQSRSSKCITLLLAIASCDPNIANSEGDTPLHIACRQECVQIIDLLLSSEKIDLHVANDHGKTPLHILFQMESFALVSILLEKGCSSRYVNREQIFQEAVDLAQVCGIGSLLHLACHYDSIGIVEFFLGGSYCTAAAVNKPDVNGDTPLHIAVRRNTVSIVKILLAYHGIDPNVKNVDGETALIAACSNDCFECTQILASFQGCDPNEQDDAGNTALCVAVQRDNCELLSVLLSNSSCDPNISYLERDTPLHLAVQTKSSKCVAALLANTSCDPNVVNSEGDTPLHIACRQGSFEIIDSLTGSNKLDLHVTNAHGITPLYILFQMKYFAMVSTLLEKINRIDNIILQEAIDLAEMSEIGSLLHLACLYGSIGIVEHFLGSSYCTAAAVNKPDVNGDTPLHIAVRINIVAIVEMLLACHVVDPNVKNVNGETALISAACSNDCFECPQILARFKGCDPNEQDDAGNTALCVAVQRDSCELVSILLSNSSCNPNISNLEDDTPLHLAVRTKSTRCVAALLASTFCDPNILNGDVDTPLHIACQQGSVEIIDLLLSSERLDIYVRNAEGKLPLHATNLETIKYFIKSGHYSLNEQDDEGNTVLHMTVQINASACVATLLTSSSCDLNKGNSEGDTPLHIACQQGSVEITDLLLSSEKVDLSSPNAQGTTPLQIVFQKKHFRLIAKLLEKSCKYLKREHILQEAIDLAQNYGIGLIHLACTYGCTGIIELFLGSSYCSVEAVNEPDMNGNTPLHIATRMNISAVVKMLLTCQGCDPNKHDNTGSTALHVAVQHSNCEPVGILLSTNSCDPNISNLQGDTPLHLAVQTKSSKCVEILLTSTSCDSNVRNCSGDTPLHIASRIGSVELVQLVTKSSHCNPNILNHRREAPLHIALASNPSFEISKLLLQTKIKCDLNIVNAAGETPLYIACKRRKLRIIEMLLQSDQCDPNISTNQGMTPLHIAIGDTHVHAKIVELLLANTECGNISNLDGDTPLHLAVQHQSIKCIKLLLANAYCDPNVANSEGDTPLHFACQQGSVQIIDLLLSSEKLGLHTANVQGMTPLHIVFQNKKLVIKLLEKTCNPLYRKELQEIVDQAEKNGIGSLLHLACIYGSTAIIELFLGSSYCTVKAVNEPDMNGDTPLHIATRTTCQYVDPNVLNCNSDRKTPPHVACRERNLKLLLSDERCDVDNQNKTGDTALHIAIQEEQISIVKYLIQDIHCNPAIPNADGNTPLHLACNKGAWNTHSSILTMVKLLLSTGRVDPECVNNDGRTPVELARGNHQIIKELSSFVDTTLKHRIQSYIKLFFMGNAYAGKSTLVQAICAEASKLRKLAPSSQFKQVTGIEPLTAGIVPLAFRSKHFGNAILYDFAGQHEYYSSHAAVLENLVLSSPPVFLLVFNLSEPTDQIREKLAYWWSFIDSHCKKTSVTPHVILIASHKDVIKSRGNNVKKIMERIIKSTREIPATFYTAGHVSLDCRSLVSNGLNELLTLLKDTCIKLREIADVNIDLRCHILYAFLTDTFQHRVACTASEIQAIIKTDNTVLPHNPTDLEKLLSTLSDMGHILFLRKSSQSFEDSWIVLQRQALLTEVHGSIFAPKNFRQHIKDLAQVTGVVPLSKIKQRFQNTFNSPTPELVIVYSLTHLEFCFKIEDYHTLEIFASDSKAQVIAQEDEEYYFFPALVQVETPTDVWKPNPQMTFQCGWFYECVHPYQFLTTRFLHVLILRLAFSFALAVDHTSSKECPAIRRRCSMWKHGIAWWNDDGIETIVEVGLQRHWVVAMMRCARDQQVECVQHRTAVIKSILDTKDEFCPSILMSESLISPTSIQYPCQKESEKALYSLKEVAKTMTKGKPYVTHDIYNNPIKLTELLPFEPYIGLSKEILEKLFSDEYLEKQIMDPDLIQIAEKSYHNLQLFKAAVKPNPLTWQRCCEQAGSNEVLLCVYLLQVFRDRGSKTFKELQTQLSKFSIFCGRNPLDVAEGKCSAVQNTAHNSNSAHTVLPSSPPSVSSTDSPQAATDIQPSSAATITESSPLQQSTEDVDSTPLAPLPSSSPSLPSTDNTRIPADLDMQVPPNSAAATAKISLLQQWTEYGEVDNTPLEVNPILSTEPALVTVSCGKETQQYQILFSNFPKLVEALSSMVSAEGLADKLYFSAGLITKDLWEEACVGGVTNSKKLRPLINSILSQVELNATNYDKFVAVLKEFDELQDIVQLLEIV